MWYTFPSDKNELNNFIDSINKYIQEFDEYVDIKETFENLAAIYSEEKPFNAESAYEMLYRIYLAMDIDDGKDKSELFGKKDSLEAFKVDFLEAWKKISYIVLTNGNNIAYSDERDKYLKIYDELHDNKKMEDNDIQKIAQNIDHLFDDGDDNDLRDNITALETSLDNQNNADNIYLEVRDSKQLKKQYITNRLQLFHQFATSDVSDIKAYIPFYGRIEDIKAKKVVSPEEVKEVAENIRNEALNSLRKQVNDLWESQEYDSTVHKISEISANYTVGLSESMNDIESDIAKEKRLKPEFFNDLAKSQAEAEKIFPEHIEDQVREFNTILGKNQKLFDDVKYRILSVPDIADYEKPMVDMLHKLENETERQADKVKFSNLYEEAEKKYTAALNQYSESLNKQHNILNQKYDENIAEEVNYEHKLEPLYQIEKDLNNQKNVLDLLPKDKLEKLIEDKGKLEQDFKKVRSEELPLREARKGEIDNLTDTVQQNVERIKKDFTDIKKKISNTFTPEELENHYKDAIHSQKAINEKYTAYFQDVEKRYAQVCAARQSLNEVFEAAGDITKKKGFFSIQKKNPKIFTDTMDAVDAYIKDRKNPKKIEAAYDACRKYVASYMKSDQSGLKSGNTDGNTRRQTIVRMLELMDKLPEFQKLVASDRKIENDWTVVDSKDTSKYTKLNYKQLEESLKKHATKPKKSGKGAQKPEKSAFYDIDKLVNKRKESKNSKDGKGKGKGL